MATVTALKKSNETTAFVERGVTIQAYDSFSGNATIIHNTAARRLRYWDGTSLQTLNSFQIYSSTPPSTSVGDSWINEGANAVQYVATGGSTQTIGVNTPDIAAASKVYAYNAFR